MFSAKSRAAPITIRRTDTGYLCEVRESVSSAPSNSAVGINSTMNFTILSNVTKPRLVSLSRLSDSLLNHQVFFNEVDGSLLLRVIYTYSFKYLIVHNRSTFIGVLGWDPSSLLKFLLNVVTGRRVKHYVLYRSIWGTSNVLAGIQFARLTAFSLCLVLRLLKDTTNFRCLNARVFRQWLTSPRMAEHFGATFRLIPRAERFGQLTQQL